MTESRPEVEISFEPAPRPITELVTKFGGQPVWNGAPSWPIHGGTGHQMEFVGQVRLDPEIFGNDEPTMAYLFVTDAVEALTYEPFGGENAVVIQPGPLPRTAETVREAEGPALHHLRDEDGAVVPAHPSECEFAVVTAPSPAGDPVDEERLRRWAADPLLEYQERAQHILGRIGGHKIGGEPDFERGWPEPFSPEEWRLLLQLDVELPFFLNLSLDGTGYMLVRLDLSEGAFFWERPG